MSSEIPPRPNDPLGSWMWDMNYGVASKANPLIKLTSQVEKLNEGAKAFTSMAGNIAEMNKALKETTAELKETNRLLKELTMSSK
uniref:Uncharacterized protein n=1 Tax=viral metagenome TaxID=1070528 RepID=A0A6M3X4R2_9ZZZZ